MVNCMHLKCFCVDVDVFTHRLEINKYVKNFIVIVIMYYERVSLLSHLSKHYGFNDVQNGS